MARRAWRALAAAAVLAAAAMNGAAAATCGTAQGLNGNGACVPCTWGKINDGADNCVACPAGLVKVPHSASAKDATCEPATTACGTAQYAKDGQCQPCTWGKVQSSDGETCVTCPANTVKSPHTASGANAVCVHALSACGTAQQAESGQCKPCTWGKVKDCATGLCAFCPDYHVKVPHSASAVDATCEHALTACGSAQVAVNGRCAPCTWGQVKSADGTQCEVCPEGTVKVPHSASAINATCVSAVEACGTAQYAKNGQCAPCTWGQVRSADGKSCVTCPAGTVKVPHSATAVDAICVHAISACGSAETAQNGQCKPCTWGQVKDCATGECVTCPEHHAKVPHSATAKDAVCEHALTACGSAQVAKNGQCAPCTWGQVKNNDGTGCAACPAGTVKSPHSASAANAACVDPSTMAAAAAGGAEGASGNVQPGVAGVLAGIAIVAVVAIAGTVYRAYRQAKDSKENEEYHKTLEMVRVSRAPTYTVDGRTTNIMRGSLRGGGWC